MNMKNLQESSRWTNWIKNVYYVGTLVSLIFIMAQAIYTRRSITQSSEWEKAKIMTTTLTQ